jgi:hypothetical protein
MRVALALVVLLVACRGGESKREQPPGPDRGQRLRPPQASIDIDVPKLSTADGTSAAGDGPLIALKDQPIASEELKRAARAYLAGAHLRIAADRSLTVAKLLPLLDQVHMLGVGEVDLQLTVGSEPRVVSLELPHAVANEQAVSNIKAFEPVPDMSIQKVVELIAANGGRITFGTAALPRVEPAPKR